MPQPIQAITFDLWDTLIHDDSDEPKRAAQGLEPKALARPRTVYEALKPHHPDLDFATVELAHRVATSAFNKVWHDQLVTWTVRERMAVLLSGLKVNLPEADLAHLVRTLEDMETVVRPDAIPGVREALSELKKKYKLAVISDAIYSPGRALRELLRGEGLLDFFDTFIFSDEVGCCKPDPRVFTTAAERLGVEVTGIVHIGDRDHNDVKGPQRLGARAVLFTATRDRDKANTTADAICERYADLPGIIARLDGAVS
ncbi:MAG: HAD family hydrolase [Candidatus Omnitrophica bacterium]|nr:Phosphoglycolate phosphatase [bacterium]NUN98582.1 HAD family hydrolase [Candidatus Omnitrophota bacterium]